MSRIPAGFIRAFVGVASLLAAGPAAPARWSVETVDCAPPSRWPVSRALEALGVRIRVLKAQDADSASIAAFQPQEVKAVHDIGDDNALPLTEAAVGLFGGRSKAALVAIVDVAICHAPAVAASRRG